MRANLPGVHKVRSRGHTYYYAWRGGPRITAEPNTPEFHVQYAEAHKAAPKRERGETLETLIDMFQDSSDFSGLSEPSKKAYRAYFKAIIAEFGDTPWAALEDQEMRGDFKEWRDTMRDTPRKADYAWTCLARVLSFGKDRGKLKVNVCERGGRLYRADRNDNIWTEDVLAALFAVASPEVSAVVTVGLWTGQRQGDILRLPWSGYDGTHIRLRQRKGDVRVTIPVGRTLADLIRTLPKHGPVMLTSSDRTPWTSDGFRASFRKACEKAGVKNLTFHDLRGTAATRLALAGSTESEIAAITGHAISDVKSILERHYISKDVELAENGMRKLEEKEARTKAVKHGVKQSARSSVSGEDGGEC